MWQELRKGGSVRQGWWLWAGSCHPSVSELWVHCLLLIRVLSLHSFLQWNSLWILTADKANKHSILAPNCSLPPFPSRLGLTQPESPSMWPHCALFHLPIPDGELPTQLPRTTTSTRTHLSQCGSRPCVGAAMLARQTARAWLCLSSTAVSKEGPFQPSAGEGDLVSKEVPQRWSVRGQWKQRGGGFISTTVEPNWQQLLGPKWQSSEWARNDLSEQEKENPRKAFKT